MDELQKLNAYCFALIGKCRETNAESMTVTQNNVTYFGDKIGDWKITVQKIGSEPKWLVWSIEHNGWWAPNRRGYVSQREYAGRYSYEDALEIVEGANFRNGDRPMEAMVQDNDNDDKKADQN